MKNSGKTSRAENRAVLIIATLLILSILLPRLFDKFVKSTNIDNSLNLECYSLPPQDSTTYTYNTPRKQFPQKKKNYRSINKEWDKYTPSAETPSRRINDIHCSAFDPNSVPEETLLEMGINSYVVKNLMKYRSSGAIFRTASDLRKIYGMDSTLFEQLQLCIQIQSKQRTSFHSDEKAWVDINTAGIEEWTALPGIGNVLATRIVKYRESLGGFHSIEQVGETYGLPPETLDSIKSMLTLSNLPMKINLNTASIDQLAGHPYISHRQAEAIVNYRSHHGEFTSIDQLMNIYSLSSDWLSRIQSYISCSRPDQQPELATR